MATDKTKKTVATAASAVTGAAVGSGATIGISQVVNASDVEAEATDIKPNEGESIFGNAGQLIGQSTSTTTNSHSSQSSESSHTTQSSQSAQTTETETPVETEDSELPEGVEVLGYETVKSDDGTLSDIAVLDVNGEVAMVIDIDRNGEGDLIISDINHDGQFGEGEVVDISGQGVNMAVYEHAASEPLPGLTPEGDIADNGPDYTNDANVDDYMA